MKDRTAIGAPPDITDVGSAEFVGAQPGEQAGQHQRQVTLGPVGAPGGLVVGLQQPAQRRARGLGDGAGQPLVGLGPPERTAWDWPGSVRRYRGSRTTHSTSTST